MNDENRWWNDPHHVYLAEALVLTADMLGSLALAAKSDLIPNADLLALTTCALDRLAAYLRHDVPAIRAAHDAGNAYMETHWTGMPRQ